MIIVKPVDFFIIDRCFANFITLSDLLRLQSVVLVIFLTVLKNGTW